MPYPTTPKRLGFQARIDIFPLRHSSGHQGHEGRMFHSRVFKREGQPCERCGTPIVKITSDSRPLFLCPRCQAAR